MKWNLNYPILAAVIIVLSTLFLPISRADICDSEVLPDTDCEVRSPAGISVIFYFFLRKLSREI